MKKHYKIISAASPNIGDFSDRVTKELNDGWEIAGPLVVSAGEDQDWLYQPLTKSESKTNP